MMRAAAADVLFEMFCIWCVVGIPVAAQRGVIALTLQTLLGFLSAVVDASVNPSNFETLRKNGFSATYIWIVAAFNLIVTNALVSVVYVLAPPAVWEPFSAHTVARVVASFAATEILFTGSHALLHRTLWGANLHFMHHCCRKASWHVNLIFNPIDMAVEFSGPVIAVLFLNWNYPLALVLSVCMIHLWYALDHSATLKLPHTRHHERINSVFSIYVGWMFPWRGRDRVRQIMKE